jgi:hypothetical protein
VGILFDSRARVSRRSNSRLSRREASLWVLSKKGSSFAIAGISFCISNHSSSSLSARISVYDRKRRASKVDGRQRERASRPPQVGRAPGRIPQSDRSRRRARLSFVSGCLGQNREAIAPAAGAHRTLRTCSSDDSNKLVCRRTIRLTHFGPPESRIFWKMTALLNPLSESPVMPTAGPLSSTIAAVGRCC